MTKTSFRFQIVALLLTSLMILFMQAGSTPAYADGLPMRATDTPTPTADVAVTPTPTVASPHEVGGSNCMMCHGNPDFHGTFKNGESVSLYVTQSDLNDSVHANAGLKCEACHTNFSKYPHTDKQQVSCTTCHADLGGSMNTQYVPLVVKLPYDDKRSMVLDINSNCRTCHEEQFKNTTGSAHEKVFESGNTAAPMCVDCHGGHHTVKPGTPRTTIVEICSKCHQAVYTSYRVSVHGEALLQDPTNPDVPTCIDCHGVHSVSGPRQTAFRGDSIVICGTCHSNKEMMKKYGISTDVFDTYLNDFHGRTVSLFQEEGTSSNKATCYDCHGIHNIRRPDDPLSSVYPANLQHTCQQCHTDASIRFPAAWMSHTEISWEKTPLLFAVRGAYSWLLIPGTIGAFLVYIALDARRRWLDKHSIVLEALAEEDSDDFDFEK